MIRTYFKIAWRNLTGSKIYSAINIIGLATGMAVAILVALWIWDELSYNAYHTNHQTLAQVMRTRSFNGQSVTDQAVAIPLGAELRNKYGGYFKGVSMASWNMPHNIRAGEKKITAGGLWVEPAFARMFSVRLQQGNANGLEDPSSILLSSSLAVTLFGSANPINRSVRLDNSLDFKVAAVYADFPRNTTLYETQFLLPWSRYLSTLDWDLNAWEGNSQAFVQIDEAGDMAKISNGIKNAPMSHLNVLQDGKEELVLFPMDSWRLHSEFKNGRIAGGRIQFVWLFGIIGIFVLLLACINFMNLSTARSEKRAREVGIRKTIGSQRRQLIKQFLTESMLVTLLALCIALVLVLLTLPFFNTLSDKAIHLPVDHIEFWGVIIAFSLFTAIVAGSYPAFYLSGFKPIQVLKGAFRAGRNTALPREVLVVVQFSISITLIIGTMIVYRQIQYAKNRSVGYSREGLISVDMMNAPDLHGHYDALRADLMATGAVENIAESSSPITETYSNIVGISWPGKDPGTVPHFNALGVTHDFGQTIQWQIAEGRDFSRSFPTDSTAVIINEAAARLIGLKNIVGSSIQWDKEAHQVVAVVKDLVIESPYEPVKPTLFFLHPVWANLVIVRLKPIGSMGERLMKVESVFRKYNPSGPFEYKFTDNEYAKKFDEEKRIGDLSTLFAGLAIFISCLGLFGLASFVAEQRTREIGVRKVLGASLFDLWQLLSKDFFRLVIISCAIAIPSAWYFLHQWLQKYSYRTDISGWIFVAAALGAMVITALTVSYQAIKAALMNPAKSLRAG